MKAPLSFLWATHGRSETVEEITKSLNCQRARVALLGKRPQFGLVLAVSETTEVESLERSLTSLVDQTYPDWNIRVCGELERHRHVVEAFADSRVQWLSTRSSSVKKLNEGVDAVVGDWIGFLDPGALLAPSALYELAVAWQKADSDLFYSFEVACDFRGKPAQFLSKPEYSWVNLVHHNYIGRFWVAKRAWFSRLNGLDPQLGPYAEHSFLLRLAEKSRSWSLVPQYLYYHEGNLPLLEGREEGAADFRVFVNEHIDRMGFRGHAYASVGRVKVFPHVKDAPERTISAIICYHGRIDWTERCVRALAACRREMPLEIILLNNGTKPEEQEAFRAALQDFPVSIQWVDYPYPFNFNRMNNWAIKGYAKGDFLLLLNNDVFLDPTTNLDEMAGWASQSWVGTVGLRLMYPTGKVQHSGFGATFGGEARLVRLGNAHESSTLVQETREVYGNTFAACLIRRSVYESVGGLRELDLPNGFGDVAFNLECIRRGYRNVFLGHFEGLHLESASRGVSYEYWEECAIERDYPDLLYKILRQDLAINRIPGAAPSLRRRVESYFKQQVLALLPQARIWWKRWQARKLTSVEVSALTGQADRKLS